MWGVGSGWCGMEEKRSNRGCRLEGIEIVICHRPARQVLAQSALAHPESTGARARARARSGFLHSGAASFLAAKSGLSIPISGHSYSRQTKCTKPKLSSPAHRLPRSLALATAHPSLGQILPLPLPHFLKGDPPSAIYFSRLGYPVPTL